jgi:hypothetical protein
MLRNTCILFFVIVSFTVSAQSAVKKELYKAARDNFSRGNYFIAIDKFSEFQKANDEYLASHPELQRAIASAITICENKIEIIKRESEPGGSGIRVQAYKKFVVSRMNPIYLLPDDSVISEKSRTEWGTYLDKLKQNPFATLQVQCLTNADSLGLKDHVTSRLTLFSSELTEINIDEDRISWEVDSSPSDPDDLSSCMHFNWSPKGTVCLKVRYSDQSEKYELEP